MHTVPVLMPFAERWNGTGWSLLPFPNLPPGAQDGGLDGVWCASGSACQAVGQFFDEGAWGLFAVRWDGSSWSLESMPDPVPPAGIQPGVNLQGLSLSCSSGSFCTAVGGYSLSSGGGRSFVERWDGSSWSLGGTIGIAAAFDTELMGVSCTSTSACVAVGDYSPSPAPRSQRTLVERWNGIRWSVERTPIRPGALVGVSCGSARACMAIGYTTFAPMVERRDGTTWSVERTPSPAGGPVSCTSSMICTVFGNSPNGSVLAEQSIPASAKLTGVAAACTRARFTARVTGAGISSVAWSLDSKAIKGHSVHRGTQYVASIRLTPGRHKLTVKVKFTASSQTHPRTLRRNVRGCSPAH